MELSVVVATLNGRERLSECLDALSEHTESEVVVVNGPSTDGTSGMVHAREDVDVLVELPERNINVSRNAGLAVASGDLVAFVDQGHRVEPTWEASLREGLGRADCVTGPTRRTVRGGATGDELESRSIAGREVSYFAGGNVAFTRETALSLDGFDEYLETGGARDAAHRLAAQERSVEWLPGMSVRGPYSADGGERDARQLPSADGEYHRWAWKYRSLAYRLAKNYGLRPTVVRRIVGHTARDGASAGRSVLGGNLAPTAWLGGGIGISKNVLRGGKDGLAARLRDRTNTRNPNGLSMRRDRAVERHDWR
jgi:glycosyltransferase involved in cell wall biosynthesis